MQETQVITGQGVEIYRLLAIRAALKLEALGMKNSRGSVAQMVKIKYGFKGNASKVLAQYNAMLTNQGII